MQIKRRSEQGFTLIELLIASALLLTIFTMTMRFLWDFNRTGQEMILSSSQVENQRTAFARIEKELMGAAAVLAAHPNDATITSTPNRLVFSVPLYNAAGFIVVNAQGRPIQDTVVLDVVDDVKAVPLSLRTPNRLPQMLRLAVTKSADSTRLNFSEQVLLRNLMPKDNATGHYACPASQPALCPLAGTAATDSSLGGTGTFVLLKRDGSVINPVDTAQLPDVSAVRIVLRNEQEYQNKKMLSHKEFEFRLRNWRPVPTPTPTPSP
ncbi:MAG: PilW family protein [Candidatus Sericytochromatia bacterium]